LALTAVPLSLLSPLSAGSAASLGASRTFVDLDERLVAGSASGVVVVRAPQDVHASIMAHAARRLRTAGWAPVDAFGTSGARPGAPLFREIATQLGLGAVSSEPQVCAEAILQAAAAKRVAIVAPLPKEGSWDRAVATELVRAMRTGLVVFVTSGEAPSWDVASVTTFEVVGELTASDKLRWLSAVAEEAQTELPGNDLRTLEGWWSKARRVTPADAASLDDLGEAARAVLACLALAGRALPIASIATLGDDAVAGAEELVAGALAVRYGTLVSLSSAVDVVALEATASEAERVAAARLLAGGPGFDPDPWAYARAAELLVAVGAVEAADAAVEKAVRGVVDGQATYEITSRWFTAVAPILGEKGLFLRLQGAHRALAMGEANDALRWCESATALEPESPNVALLMGRALMQLGDLVAARVSLHKAQTAAVAARDDELRACVACELAELSYFGGDFVMAAEHANRAVTLATTVGTRLGGRNTLGKINLVEARWDAADEHFAEDVLTASAAGDAIAELRARLNRGVALMSKGALDDARVILNRVLEDAAGAGEDRARAYAYANLGVIAFRQHDYGVALSCWEQAVRFRPTLRGRIASARTIANLAELRLRLGLVDHAEHALTFGRRLLGFGTTADTTMHFAVVAARIAQARGNGEVARREINAALLDGAPGDKDYLGEAYRVAARVALDDGDVTRSSDALVKAEKLATNDRGRAEVAIVRALYLRATGQSAIETATTALSLARTAGEEDLLSEIHTLLAILHRDSGDLQSAQAHCCRAIAVRDQVAAGLPVEIRSAFLAKPDVVALSRLQASLASQDADVDDEPPRTLRNSAPPPDRVLAASGASREIIGDDPQIRSLAVAIRKVARSNSTILIRGESGTGKELVAEALHRASDRAGGPLVSVNCAALVETLLLSELFGHEKGAFTGAASRRRGRFEMAENGTLFLDEIGDISARTQVALLRVLQEKTFERVGGAQSIHANVRVICATHRDLKGMVERGEFREDLYYRLRGITLEVPALRARLGDLPKIADHLLGRIATERSENAKTIAPDAVELLQRHRWPGNIRELENVLRAVSLFADGDVITPSDLIDNVDDLRALAQAGPCSQPPLSLRSASLLPPPPAALRDLHSGSIDADDELGEGSLPDVESGATAVAYAQVRQGAVSLSDMKRQIERDCIARALEETKGNITRAATLLGMKRPRLSQLVKQYGLSSASSEGSQ
jgi:transcriptional regulator with GAF, ATPase, and Fis domain